MWMPKLSRLSRSGAAAALSGVALLLCRENQVLYGPHAGVSYAITDEELRYMDTELFNTEVANVADRFRPFMKNPDKNNELISYSYPGDKSIKVFYPHNRRLTNDASGLPYARVATMTVNAPISAISAMWYGDANANNASNPGEWNAGTVRDFRTVSLLPPPSLQVSDQGPGGKLGQLNKAAAKRKQAASSASSSSSSSSHVNPRNVQLCHETSLIGPYTSHFVSLAPREFYYWSVLSPAALVGVYDKYTSVCVVQVDASGAATTGGEGGSKLSKGAILPHNDIHGTIPPPASSFGYSGAIRAHRNSALLLESVTPDKTKVTFAVEMDPRIGLMAKDATASGAGAGVPMFEILRQFWFLSDAHAFGSALRAMKNTVERQYAAEDQGLSVEEAARLRFKRQTSERERASLSASVAGGAPGQLVASLSTTSSPNNSGKNTTSNDDGVYSGAEAVADQQRLVGILERRLASLHRDEAELRTASSNRRSTGSKAAQAAAAAQAESEAAELTALRVRVEKDLGRAREQLEVLKTAAAAAAAATSGK